MLAWRFTKSGVYTVRSAYVDVLRHELEVQLPFEGPKAWDVIWGLEVIPKIQFFMWKLMHGILPSTINLISRFVDVDPLCKRCGVEIKTAEHALRDCSGVHRIWREDLLNLGVDYADGEDRNLGIWVAHWLSSMSTEKKATFATTLWVLWWSRNKLVFEDTRWSCEQIISQVSTGVEEFRLLACSFSRRSSPGGPRTWVPPAAGSFKLNVDAAVRIGEGVAVAGVLRDGAGTVCWCFAETMVGGLTVDVAEAVAVRRGLEVARQQQVDNFCVESDSQTVVATINRHIADRSYLGCVVQDIWDLRRGFNNVTFNWLRRSGNYLAHNLASFGCNCSANFFSTHLPDGIAIDVEPG